ncbi:hypothetical protein HN018_21885 (plasmid) [Lichenicola cladoniae]|uniref:Uncharacterized protein n=1 Tax=Lichenicola cladoniae TaxID=1484109 RepID=A0A6M8HWV0_9PROT|nr:hypothetical protein [Lichenicola cladoniae]NPD68983.1 hypothetical protein [Acetobacteraceae bacterium]QKE92882.1 hypothetical protein HN018_21885 [Lichenicola cladoniae]
MDLFAAVWFARQDRMGLVVAPLLLILSWLLGRSITLVFEAPFNLFAIAVPAFIVTAIAGMARPSGSKVCC